LSRFFLLDGTGLVYRAFFAIRELTTSSGKPVNALFGLSRTLLRLAQEYFQPGDYVAFFMDRGRTTFRTRLLESYKAHRPETPEALKEQMALVQELVEGFGIPVRSQQDFEADDLIATFVRTFREEVDTLYVISSDKDLLQLVDDKVEMLRPETGVAELKRYTPEQVQEKYGVTPGQMNDYLALVGDPSDNIPGVKGVGKKTAETLLAEFQTLEGMYRNLSAVKPSFQKKLEEGKQMAFLSKKLVALHKQVPFEGMLQDFRYKGPVLERIAQLFQVLEFRSMLGELQKLPVSQEPSAPSPGADAGEALGGYETAKDLDYRTVSSASEFQALLEELQPQEAVAFDLETDSLNPREAHICGVSLCCSAGKAYYLPFAHTGDQQCANNPPDRLAQLVELLGEKIVVGHNLKFDFGVLMARGFDLPERAFDTMIAAYLCDPERSRYGLDGLVKEKFQYAMQSFKEVMGEHSFAQDFSMVPVQAATRYSAEDADFCWRLYLLLKEELERLSLVSLMEMVEMPVLRVLLQMEHTGVFFDRGYLKELSERFQEKIARRESEVFSLCGEEFNLNSPVQLGRILFEKMGLPAQGRTAKSKNYATGKAVLETLANDFEVARLILEYRKFSKLKSTYVDAIPRLIDAHTGRVHSSFHQTGTATGRLSSSEPNLQNLPVKEEEGREIRAAIRAETEGWQILSADYSQIELRLMAHLSGDSSLLEAFSSGKDVHTLTASRIFGIPLSEVDDASRSVGKTINFSIIYGISAFGLSNRLGIGRKEAQKFIDGYFAAYPGVLAFQKSMVENAKKKGYVRTLLGRIRNVRGLDAKNPSVRGEAERIAINSPVQGSAADIIKIAMIRVQNELLHQKWKSRLIIQIHDELVFEVHPEEREMLCAMVTKQMEGAMKLHVPMKVDLEMSDHF